LRGEDVGSNCHAVANERVHQEHMVMGDAFGQVLLACDAGGGAAASPLS